MGRKAVIEYLQVEGSDQSAGMTGLENAATLNRATPNVTVCVGGIREISRNDEVDFPIRILVVTRMQYNRF